MNGTRRNTAAALLLAGALLVSGCGSLYYTVFKGVDALGIPNDALADFDENDPQNFEKNVKAYKAIDKAQEDSEREIRVFLDRYYDLNRNPSYADWRDAANDTHKINRLIKNYADAYEQAPPIVQKYFDKPMNYFKIDVAGDYGNWDAHVERPTEYPDAEAGGDIPLPAGTNPVL